MNGGRSYRFKKFREKIVVKTIEKVFENISFFHILNLLGFI